MMAARNARTKVCTSTYPLSRVPTAEDRLLAQGMFLELLFSHKKPELLDVVVLQQ